MFINPNKKYGLIIPNKSSQSTKPVNSKPLVKPCIFDEDDELEQDDTDPKSNKKPHLQQVNTSSSVLKKQTQIQIEKALEEDKNVFEYDEIYDELEKEKQKLDPKQKQKSESKEPKYIVGIMKAAAKRKMEYEKIQERKIHKEREAEGDMWSDKEVFVTTAYRKKMEERQKIEEEERRQEEIENLLDVRKQKDLRGFYSAMLKMKTGELVIEEEAEKEKRLEKEKAEEIKFKEKTAKSSAKSYRAKKEEEEEDEVEEEENIAPEEVNEEKKEETQIEPEENVVKEEFKEPLAKKTKQEEEEKENIEEVKKENVPKLSKEEERRLRLEKIFTKRTVKEKFDAELNDYFIRKTQALSLKNYIERE